MVKIGFAKQDLADALRPAEWPVREERVEAIAMYIADAEKASLWITLDFMDFNLGVINEIKAAVCEKLSLEKEAVHVLTTHNHGGGSPDLAVLSDLCAACAEKAKLAARTAKMRMAKGTADKQISIIRRKYIPELAGVTTLFYGASEEEGFNASPFTEKAISNLKEGYVAYYGREETDKAPDPFAPGDETIFAVQFCDEAENPIGTIVRFAAHAVCCNRDGSFSSDYPYHIRKNTEAHFGGITMFLNGPCAEIAPGMTGKTDGSEKRLGRYIADIAIAALSPLPFSPITAFADKAVPITLPVRKEVIENHVPFEGEMPEDLPARRAFLERERYKNSLPFLREKYAEGETSLSGETEISFGMLRLNDLLIAAFPGETFSETGKQVCKAFSPLSVCTVTEHGRTVMYMPPEAQCAQGGYESVCRVTDEAAEAILRRKATEALKMFAEESL